MTLKAFSLYLVLVLVAATVTAALVIFGNHYINKKESSKTEDEPSSSWFSSAKPKEVSLQFVEIKNLVITLKNETSKERYLLLDLALTTHDDPQTNKTESLLPKIKGITVDVLSSMEYSEIRKMSVVEFRQMMMTHYQSAFKNIHVTIPFDDVIVSKMIFQ